MKNKEKTFKIITLIILLVGILGTMIYINLPKEKEFYETDYIEVQPIVFDYEITDNNLDSCWYSFEDIDETIDCNGGTKLNL